MPDTTAISGDATARRRKPETSSTDGDGGSIKETIEAILVAFILAFIFRGFVVEAFVIPTGSMAPTLLGAHMRFTCDDCGYQFDVNYSAQGSGDDLNVPSQSDKQHNVVCPNCGYELRKAEPSDQAFRPLVRYGDRILVLKFLYLFQEPKRWDVIVFKSPDRPDLFDYSQNYIKRLIGRPGEAIMVLDGDIYAGDANAPREALQVQTKPREVQEALWRIIHDNDYEPRGVPRATARPYQQPWTQRTGGSGWDVPKAASPDAGAHKRVFHFDNPSGRSEIFFNDTVNIGGGFQRTSAFNDWLPYDTEEARTPEGGWSLVGDLKLQFFYERMAGDGPVRLTLSKRGQQFVAEISAARARLLSSNSNSDERELIAPVQLPAHQGPMRVEFSNVDYRVTLRVNDQVVFQTTREQYHPDIAALLTSINVPAPVPQVAIAAEKQNAVFSHISLWRDVYYLNRGQRHDPRTYASLGPFSGSPDSVMRLKSDEYFAMGDNSQISGDGRYWTDATVLPYEGLDVDAGKVPARFLLGKAFFVYWPAGFRPFESASVPALAPNFGDMRMIH